MRYHIRFHVAGLQAEELLDKLTLDFVTFVLNAADFSQTLNSVWGAAFIRFTDYLHPGIWLCSTAKLIT